MLYNNGLLVKKDIQEDKDEKENLDIFGKKKRKSGVIKDYVFNCLKKVLWKKNDNLLTIGEERALFDEYRENWDVLAFNKIVVTNLKFVVYLAKKFYKWLKSQYNCNDIYLDDLIQEWNIWLIKAAQKYVPDDNSRFLSYARHVIISNMYSYVTYKNHFFWSNNGRGVPKCKARQMEEYVKKFIQKNQREPQDEELEKFYKSEDSSSDYSVNIGYYKYLLQGALSIDTSFKELAKKSGEKHCKYIWGFWDLIGFDDWESDIKDLMIDVKLGEHQPMDGESLSCDINRALSILSERDQKIMKMLFGLDWYREYSLEEVSDYFGLTRERVRQIRENSFKDLREDDTVYKLLRDYMI